MSSPILQHTTPRLSLRPPRQSDAEAIYKSYAMDPEVTRYLGWPRHTELSATQEFIEFSMQKWEQDQIGPYLILDKLSERIIGGTGLELDGERVASTGYVLARQSWGQGFATEALNAMVEIARDLPIDSVFALCHPEHRASINVLEKCGFKLEERIQNFIEFPNLQSGVKAEAVRYGLSTK